MANNRVFYASHGVALAKETGDTSLASPIYNRSGTVQGLIAVAGANSVTMNTNFNLEQVFQLGQLELYDNVVTDPNVECTISKTLDGHPSIYELAVGTGGIVANANKRTKLVMGVGGGDRIVINDRKPNSKRDTAYSINLNRNEGVNDVEI